ncbi:MAG: hypothetical protein ABIL11_05255 [Chloroflexota bacterium]
MAERVWEVSKVCYCEHANREVALETQVVYPIDFLPDQPPRVTARRCSHGMICQQAFGNQFAQPACIWAGTNPDYDPFRQ